MDFLSSIPFVNDEAIVQPIRDGYSRDEKYVVEKNGSKYLLRVFEASLYSEKEREFILLRSLCDKGVRCPQALEMGRLNKTTTENRASFKDALIVVEQNRD